MSIRLAAGLGLALLLAPAAFAQEPSGAAALDLGRAPGGGDEALTLDHVLGRGGSLSPTGLRGLQWHPDGKRVTWVERAKGGSRLVAEPIAGGAREVLLRNKALRDAWKAAELPGRPSVSGALTWIDADTLRCAQGANVYRIHLDPLRIEPVLATGVRGVNPIAFAAGDAFVSYVKDHDVWVAGPDGTPTRVTRGGSDDVTYGVSVSRNEIGIRDGMWWCPNARRLAFYKEDRRQIPRYPYADFRPTPASAVYGRYPMAGGKDSIVYVGVHDTAGGETVWLDTDPTVDEYLTNVTWAPDGKTIYVVHVNRDQNVARLIAYDATTGARGDTLLTERDEQWVEPEITPRFLPDGSGRFVWFSRRDGYRQPYICAADGTVGPRLMTGDYDVLSFVEFTEDGKAFDVVTTGPDARQRHLYRIAVDGGETPLTKGRGCHRATVSPDGRHVLDTHTSLELPLAVDVTTIDGTRVRRVHEADNPLAKFRTGTHRFFGIESTDGHALHGHVIFPPDAKPGGNYPVIHYVYGGPHAQLVTDTWLGGRGRWMVWMHYMASRGYVVIRVDNRGTPNRGIEFEQAIHRRLGQCEVDDQVAALEWLHGLGLTDRTRVGVHGWSYGGYMTLMLATKAGKHYKAAVSGAPVTDWKYYEVGYGERYMDTPKSNPEGYKAARPASHLDGLKARLLVVHGTADDVVMLQNTVDFVDRCIEEGVEVETMIYPGQRHGLGGKSFAHFLRKMTRFFDRELLATPAE